MALVGGKILILLLRPVHKLDLRFPRKEKIKISFKKLQKVHTMKNKLSDYEDNSIHIESKHALPGHCMH
jgi:hypothetical protein